METLDRTFRPRIGWIMLRIGVVIVAAAFLCELAISPFTGKFWHQTVPV